MMIEAVILIVLIVVLLIIRLVDSDKEKDTFERREN